MASVKDILGTKGGEVWTVDIDAPVKTALQILADKKIGALPVMSNGRIAGIFSERDFARYAATADDPCGGVRVRDLMVSPVYFVSPEQTLDDCMAVMTAKKLRHLPVIQDEVLVGLVSIGDVVKVVIAEKQNTIKDLEHFLWVNMI